MAVVLTPDAREYIAQQIAASFPVEQFDPRGQFIGTIDSLALTTTPAVIAFGRRREVGPRGETYIVLMGGTDGVLKPLEGVETSYEGGNRRVSGNTPDGKRVEISSFYRATPYITIYTHDGFDHLPLESL